MEINAVLQESTGSGTPIVVLPRKPFILVATPNYYGFPEECRPPNHAHLNIKFSLRSYIYNDTKVATACSVGVDSNIGCWTGVGDNNATPETNLSEVRDSFSGDELTQQQEEQLYTVLTQYGDVLAAHLMDLRKTNEIQHTV